MTQETHKRLRDALEAARLVQQQVSGVSRKAYDADPWFRSAVERQVEIIGEALNHVRRLDPEIESAFPDIHEWVAVRNLVAHVYDRVDHDIVWDTITSDIPVLIQRIEQILQ
jgi:uncharacterized protein with HEPN domain